MFVSYLKKTVGCCIAWLVIMTYSWSVKAQTPILSQIHSADSLHVVIDIQPAGVAEPRTFTATDSLAAIREAKVFLQKLYQKGYLAASVYSVHKNQNDRGGAENENKLTSKPDADTLYIAIQAGSQYVWVALQPGNYPVAWQKSAGFFAKSFSEPLTPDKYARRLQKMTTVAANNGYPFAAVSLDSIAIISQNENQKGITAQVSYRPGPYMVFDTLRLTGNSRINKKFLARYLQLYPGEPYSKAKVNAATELINQLPYIELKGLPVTFFELDKAIIQFETDKQQASRFDGVAGLLPNAPPEGGFILTGEIEASLQNLFNVGHTLQAHWQRLRQNSQLINLSYDYPVVFGTPVNVAGSFYLLREDTLFLNRNTVLEANVRRGAYSKIGAFVRDETSTKFTDRRLELNSNNRQQFAPKLQSDKLWVVVSICPLRPFQVQKKRP